jgi:hypothetical protein
MSQEVAKACLRVPLHVVCDNYSTHKNPKVAAWLARKFPRHPALHLHQRAMGEHGGALFGIIARQAIRRAL